MLAAGLSNSGRALAHAAEPIPRQSTAKPFGRNTHRMAFSASAIDETLVATLIADQFPHFTELPIRRVPHDGWDNRSFRLGEDLVVRLPSAARYAAQVEREQTWLPYLAPRLRLPIPHPVARGSPSRDYPWAWSIYRWIPGEQLARSELGFSVDLARDLAGFLRGLQEAPSSGGPAAGPDNFYRGGALSAYDPEMKRALQALPSDLARPLSAVWEAALGSTWHAEPVWVHGDFAPRNLLIQDGRAVGVIDFGQLAIGDPACDLVIAWTYLRGEARAAFQDAVNLDEATWARSRGWAAWKAAILHSRIAAGPRADVEGAAIVLAELLSDPKSAARA
jgi:aminoglycoside phosphotransferase (APT) family kinase protein